MNTKIKPSALLLGIALFLLPACDDGNIPFHKTEQFQTSLKGVIDHYAGLVYANYQDALQDAEALHTATQKLVDNPSPQTLENAKKAWLQSRETYGQTEAFRFYGGPIDGENGIEGRLNAWPLDESYIDYVNTASNGEEQASSVNIINSVAEYPTISTSVIANMNEVGAETNVSTGYHAVEFLLWGQDESAGAGEGMRPYTDYVTDGSGTNQNQARRGLYLLAATSLIVEDLQFLANEWKPNGGYRRVFASEKELMNSLEKIISGLGKFSKGELAGERIFVSWDLRNKEDEHSCFSDNTHRDIVANIQGILNVYTGNYISPYGRSMKGEGLKGLIALGNPSLASSILEQMQTSLERAKAIQPPFDQEILNTEGRGRIQQIFTSLRKQGDLLSEVSQLFGFTFNSSPN